MTEKQRIGLCSYCDVPLMSTDHYCVGCGAPAILSLPDYKFVDVVEKHFTDGGIMPPSLWADWNAPNRI